MAAVAAEAILAPVPVLALVVLAPALVADDSLELISGV